jgi:hypothetical protein
MGCEVGADDPASGSMVMAKALASTPVGSGARLHPIAILPPQDGFLFFDRSRFRASFAADVSAELAAYMADSRVPCGVQGLKDARQRCLEVEAQLVLDSDR